MMKVRLLWVPPREDRAGFESLHVSVLGRFAMSILDWPECHFTQTTSEGVRATEVTTPRGARCQLRLNPAERSAYFYEGRVQIVLDYDEALALEAILTGTRPIAVGQTIDLSAPEAPDTIDHTAGDAVKVAS